MARYFHAGDPGLPDEGIIIGHGGGFTLQYSNLILLGTGRARFMTYITDYEGRIPQDYESATILHNDYSGEFREYVRQLERMSFWNMSGREPQSTEIEYVVAISPVHGLNAVKWQPEIQLR